MTRALITQMLEALDACRDWPGAFDKCSAAITASREYLAAPCDMGPMCIQCPGRDVSADYKRGFRDGEAEHKDLYEVDASENAPWLTAAHVLCTEQGIAQGHMSERLEALRGKLAAPEQEQAPQPAELTDEKIMQLDDYARGDEYQRCTEDAAAMLRAQAQEIERLALAHECNVNTIQAIDAENVALRTEIDRLRSELQNKP